jgi:hypothetical protein
MDQFLTTNEMNNVERGANKLQAQGGQLLFCQHSIQRKDLMNLFLRIPGLHCLNKRKDLAILSSTVLILLIYVYIYIYNQANMGDPFKEVISGLRCYSSGSTLPNKHETRVQKSQNQQSC